MAVASASSAAARASTAEASAAMAAVLASVAEASAAMAVALAVAMAAARVASKVVAEAEDYIAPPQPLSERTIGESPRTRQ